MSHWLVNELFVATWQTIYMVFLSSFVSIVCGLLVGVILFLTRPHELLANRWINLVLGAVVNVTRSVPFVIFMIAIIPLTRLLVGTSIGTNAAVVPLALAAIPFFARIAESALVEVDKGLIEAAVAMGATPSQIVRKVLIPEALPSLLNGATLTIISLIGYSAMAGAVGGGGLGELAIQYGYQRFNVAVMLETVVILVIMVQLVQSGGNWLAKRRKLWPLALLSVVLWVACIVSIIIAALPHEQRLKLGIMSGTETKIMQVAKKVALQRYGLHLQLISFDDYILPNTALNSGNIDANIFQHVPYLDTQIKARGYHLTPIAKTFIYPMGVFSRKIHSLKQLRYGAIAAIPNDPSNEGRALLLFQKEGLIKLKPGVGLLPTPADIVQNPHGLRFKALAAAQLPRVLKDATLVVLTNDFVKPAGFTVKQALFHEGKDSPYANVLVVRTQDRNKPIFKKLIAVIHSKPVLEATLKAFPNGAAIKAW